MVASPLISIFLPSLRGGGVERMRINLAQHFVKRGYKVDIVLVKREGPYLRGLPENVNVVDLKARQVLTSLPALARYLRSAQPTVLLSAMDHSNIVALWAKRLARVQVRVVVSVHTTLSMEIKHSNTRSWLIPYLARWCYGWADGVVAVSRGAADDLSNTIGLPREKIRAIYNPVVVPELFELAKEQVNSPWFNVDDLAVVLSVGRLNAAKDYPTLLRAFSLVIKERPVRLVILGEGEERAGLEVMVRDLGMEDVVSLPGFTKNPYAYMSKAAVLVLSSAWEGFGNVLVEAMAVGTPVVATDCPNGPAEILENGKYGRLVPVGDAEAMAEGILATLDGTTDSEALQYRAKEFSYDDIADQYLEVLHGGE
ncbi:MAG: glycosyltransferase [Gammaproteobacteria bacterium]|nr:glycosyltransferase [Gammaproteobacteria bacterium]